MPNIPIGGARQRGMERFRTVIRAQYGAELAAAIAAYTPALPAGFVCPPPAAAGVFISRTTDPDEAVRNHGAVITMAPGSARRPVQRYTGGPTEFKIQTTLEIDVAVSFEAQMQPTPVASGGLDLEEDELLHLMGELHSAALINCLHKYAPDSDTIHDLELVDDYPPEILDGKRGVFGLVLVTFRVTQFVLVPARRALP